MRFAIQLGSWLLWLPLIVLALSTLLRLGPRRYPLIFAYLIVTFLVNAAQAPVAFSYNRGDRRLEGWYQTIYSIGDGVTYILLLGVVVTFFYKATARMESRRLARTVATVGSILLVSISSVVHYRGGVGLGAWMSAWTRDVQFGAAVLDLGAWGILVAFRDRDSRLLLLTGGLGIKFAGEAVGAALFSISIPYRSVPVFYSGHVVRLLATAAFLYIWWQTFRNEAKARSCAAVTGK